MATAIKNVFYFTATPVECCDRCGQGIKHVAMVTYRDGATQKYGMDCIEKILANVPDLKALFQKNLKLASRYRGYLAILTGPVEGMKRGREYFDSGLYFIADADGKDIMFESWYFHPVFDADKNAAGGRYVVADPAAHVARCEKDIAAKLPKLRAELERIETFLARVLTKAQAAEAAAAAGAL